MSAYSERLKHPMWQRKRLEILERDKFTCTSCLSEDQTLHVHHLYYVKGAEPWDYPSSSLITLCHECHAADHEVSATIEKELIRNLRTLGCDSDSLDSLAWSIYVAQSVSSDAPLSAENWRCLSNIVEEFLKFARAGGDTTEVWKAFRRLVAVKEAA